jgi:hypothetical protein
MRPLSNLFGTRCGSDLEEACDSLTAAAERADMSYDVDLVAPVGTFHRCSSHWFEPSVAECKDCRGRVCVHCIVEVPHVGIFCKPCALVRAGVRTRQLTA